MLENLGGKGGVYSLGVWDSTGGQKDRCEGKTGWLEGVLCRARVKTTLESPSRGGSVFSTNT